jgi:hypothetical protein
VIDFITGANATCAAVAGLFFARFWRQTEDALFARFALAFWMLSLHWLLLAATSPDHEFRPLLFLIRLAAFSVIIAAIVAKNRLKSTVAR